MGRQKPDQNMMENEKHNFHMNLTLLFHPWYFLDLCFSLLIIEFTNIRTILVWTNIKLWLLFRILRDERNGFHLSNRSKPKSDPIINLVDASKSLVLKDQTFHVDCDASVFVVNNFTLYIAVQDIYEIVQHRAMLNIAVIHLWML